MPTSKLYTYVYQTALTTIFVAINIASEYIHFIESKLLSFVKQKHQLEYTVSYYHNGISHLSKPNFVQITNE